MLCLDGFDLTSMRQPVAASWVRFVHDVELGLLAGLIHRILHDPVRRLRRRAACALAVDPPIKLIPRVLGGLSRIMFALWFHTCLILNRS